MAWPLRGIVVAVLIVLVVLAIVTRTADSPSAVAVTVPTARPTPTLEAIISRVTRVTPEAIPTRTSVPADQPLVSAVDFGFLPQDLRIQVGQTVTWVNDGRELHDVTGDDWFSGPIEPKRLYRHTFGFAGRFEYRCSVWSDMRGSIVVSP
jgi:plastocyanin